MRIFFRFLYLLGIAALVLSIYGGSIITSDKPSTLKMSATLRHVGGILFAVLCFFLFLVHAMCWTDTDVLKPHRRMVCKAIDINDISFSWLTRVTQLLAGISLALPFIVVRIVYSILSSYSGSPIPNSDSTGAQGHSLSKFNMINGTWWIYLVMGLLMEYIAVCIYTIVGLMTPTQRDEDGDYASGAVNMPERRSSKFQVIKEEPAAQQWHGPTVRNL